MPSSAAVPTPAPAPPGSCPDPPPLDDLTTGGASSYEDCPAISTYYGKDNPTDGDPITFDKIAQGWIDSGGNKTYCQHFLRTLAGECSDDGNSCVYTGGGSGLMQLDSTRTFLLKDYPPGENAAENQSLFNWLSVHNNNPCYVAHFARDLFVTQPNIAGNDWRPQTYGDFTIDSPNNACYVDEGPVNKYWKVEDWQSAYDTPGSKTCNFIGPFCHRGINSNPWKKPDPNAKWTDNTAKTIWNGGGNPGQGPFTCYSNIKMVNFSGKWDDISRKVSKNCDPNTGGLQCTRADCDIIEQAAIQGAQGFCDKTTLPNNKN